MGREQLSPGKHGHRSFGLRFAPTFFLHERALAAPIISFAGEPTMNRAKVAAYLDDTEVRPRERPADSLDAFGGILIGVLAGSATWLAIIAVVLNLP
jgi:hypothetical protein